MPIDTITPETFNALQLGVVGSKTLGVDGACLVGLIGFVCGGTEEENKTGVFGLKKGLISASVYSVLGFGLGSCLSFCSFGFFDMPDYSQYADRIHQVITTPILSAQRVEGQPLKKELIEAFRIDNQYSQKEECMENIGSLFDGTLKTRETLRISFSQEVQRMMNDVDQQPEIDKGSYFMHKNPGKTLCNIAGSVMKSPPVVAELQAKKQRELEQKETKKNIELNKKLGF
jgi:hypothetical protein